MVDSSKYYTFCLLSSTLCLLSFSLCGCTISRRFNPDRAPYEKISACYNLVRLKTSSSHDVLRIFRATNHGLEPEFKGTHVFSQSDTAVASVGQSRKGYKTWFTLVAFDESSMATKGKYFYLVDEKALPETNRLRNFHILPKPGLLFDCQIILSDEMLNKPYTTEQERQIAILKQVVKNLDSDAEQLSQDNQMLGISSMLIKQVLETVLLVLDKSPVLAKKLSEEGGVGFDHINFGTSLINVTTDENIVTVKIRSGVFTRIFDN